MEVILGIEWLRKLGEVTVDWGKLTMMYQQGEKKVIVRGDPTLERRVVGPEALLKIKHAEAWMIVWELGSIEAQGNVTKYVGLTENQRGDMEKLLGQYEVVFKEPTSLPPIRDKQHKITLKEGNDPINVRPYRYPHVMKTEIEQQIAEMLRTGVVRPSHSPIVDRTRWRGEW